MKTVSLGFMREDDELVILATLNNNEGHFTPEFFDQLVRGLAATMCRELDCEVQTHERQDTPDYVCIDDECWG